ncbi:MAG: FHA domain-containing protein [Bifidobacteriaceae bacterium]|jgi:hypothetical protein|nr:FHA domain-containing protein [Bifidobacteriaceae bacterium]
MINYRITFADGTVYKINRSTLLGKNPDGSAYLNTDIIKIKDTTKSISKNHLHITFDKEGNPMVRDLGSTNGSYIGSANNHIKIPTTYAELVPINKTVYMGNFAFVISIDKDSLVDSDNSADAAGMFRSDNILDQHPIVTKIPDRKEFAEKLKKAYSEPVVTKSVKKDNALDIKVPVSGTISGAAAGTITASAAEAAALAAVGTATSKTVPVKKATKPAKKVSIPKTAPAQATPTETTSSQTPSVQKTSKPTNDKQNSTGEYHTSPITISNKLATESEIKSFGFDDYFKKQPTKSQEENLQEDSIFTTLTNNEKVEAQLPAAFMDDLDLIAETTHFDAIELNPEYEKYRREIDAIEEVKPLALEVDIDQLANLVDENITETTVIPSVHLETTEDIVIGDEVQDSIFDFELDDEDPENLEESENYDDDELTDDSDDEQESEYTLQQALDPETDLLILADIVKVAPHLRVAVAKNPSTYKSLLKWLKSLDDPEINQAIKNRRR